MTEDVAKELLERLTCANEQLGLAVRLAKDRLSEPEFEVWQEHLSAVIGSLFLDALDPLYKEHPSLAPDALRGEYPVE